MSSFTVTIEKEAAPAESARRTVRAIPMQRRGNLTPAYRVFRDRATGRDAHMTVEEYLGRRKREAS